MAKPSTKHANDAQAESECCRRTRERQLDLIRELYLSFPVIRDMPCPTCNRILQIRVYQRPEG